MLLQKQASHAATHGMAEQNQSAVVRHWDHHLIQELTEVLYIISKVIHVHHTTILHLTIGISMASHLQKEHTISCLIEVIHQLVILEEALTESVTDYDGSQWIRMDEVIVM